VFNWWAAAVLAVAAGLSLVVQQALNADLRKAIDSAAWAGFVSYVGGTVCMLALALALRDPLPPPALVARVPWWVWSGGLFGAIFIGLSIFLLPRLGATTFVALLVAGQMLSSLAFDHFGLFGLARRPADPARLLGIALLVGGVVLVRR
jgi:bacterial/archaeal transporter family-2 protein